MPPLVGQRGAGHRPALPLDADQLLGGDEDVGEEDLVELGVTGHLDERAHLDAWSRHVDDERRDALLGPRRVGIGAGQAQPPGGELRVGGPHLAPGDDVAALDRFGLVLSEARSLPASGSLKSWHQISSAERIFGQVRQALVLGPVGQQRRADEVDADAVDRLGRLRAGVLALVERDLNRGGAAPAVGLGPVHADPAVGRQRGLPGAAPGHLVGQVDEGGRPRRGARPARRGTRRRRPRPLSSAPGPCILEADIGVTLVGWRDRVRGRDGPPPSRRGCRAGPATTAVRVGPGGCRRSMCWSLTAAVAARWSTAPTRLSAGAGRGTGGRGGRWPAGPGRAPGRDRGLAGAQQPGRRRAQPGLLATGGGGGAGAALVRRRRRGEGAGPGRAPAGRWSWPTEALSDPAALAAALGGPPVAAGIECHAALRRRPGVVHLGFDRGAQGGVAHAPRARAGRRRSWRRCTGSAPGMPC